MVFIRQIKKQLKKSKKEGEGLVALKEFNLYPPEEDDDDTRVDKVLSETLLQRPAVNFEEPTPVSIEVEDKDGVGEDLDEDRLQSYSHGLEDIYSLENVDLSTVRRLGGTEEKKEVVEVTEELPEIEESQEFDFGDEWRGWMPSLMLKEPISVLGLPEQVQKSFLDDGRTQLGDICHLGQEDMMGLAIGQGHIDEVRQRLKQYLSGKSLQKSYRVDYISWLRCLLADAEPKQRSLALESWGLAELFPLTPAENMEIRRMSDDLRQKSQKEAFQQLVTDERRRRFGSVWRQVLDTFVKPWVRWRGGVASYDELLERLQRIAVDEKTAQDVLPLFAHLFFNGSLPFGGYLAEVESKLFAVDSTTAENFRQVLVSANSCFYSQELSYPLEELVAIIEREHACQWSSYPQDFVVKVLRFSAKFRVRKGECGTLIVRLNALVGL